MGDLKHLLVPGLTVCALPHVSATDFILSEKEASSLYRGSPSALKMPQWVDVEIQFPVRLHEKNVVGWRWTGGCSLPIYR